MHLSSSQARPPCKSGNLLLSEPHTNSGCVLGIVGEMPVFRHDGKTCIHLSFGRVIDELACRHPKTLLCCPTRDAPPDGVRDYCISENVEIVPQPYYASSMAALSCVLGILRAYWRVCKRSDVLFVRGMLPYVGFFYLFAWLFGRRPCHWIVGNPMALLKSHSRSGRLKDFLSSVYAWQDRLCTHLGRRLTGGAFVCNGQELADIYASPRTMAVVSSTIRSDEFFVRKDTCRGRQIRILFVGFVRPEKGLEYLIDALPLLRTERPWRLTVVGPWKGYETYKSRLDNKLAELELSACVHWVGYVSYGTEMWEYLRSHDVFVLPTLSEGTPRVLVEARANSLPIVATRVGGIPTSVTDQYDGLLVEPRNPEMIAEAVNRIVADHELRRSLIQHGLESAKRFTVEGFANMVLPLLKRETAE